MVETKFKYGEFEGAFDLSDYLTAEKWEDALTAFRETLSKTAQHSKESEKIKIQVNAITDVFDQLFGDDASNQVLGGTTSLNEAFAAFSALHEFARVQSSGMAEQWSAVVRKYTPQNRQQRRGKNSGKS